MKLKKIIVLFMIIVMIMLFANTVVYAVDDITDVALLEEEEQDKEKIEEPVEESETDVDIVEKEEELEGTYYIATAINNKHILDIEDASKTDGASLQIWEKFKIGDNQKFQIKSTGDGYYTIEAVHSEKALDVTGAGTANGTKVQQYTSNETDAQKWKIVKNEDDTYSIISKCNGLYLDIPGAEAKNGVKIQVYEGNGTQAQKFELFEIKEEIKEDIEEIEGKQTIENGIYKIKTSSNRAIGLDVESLSRADSANVQIWSESNLISRNQRFEVTYKGNGYYEIKAQHSGKSLDVVGAGKVNGTNVQQYTSNGTDAQMWKILKNTDGTYSIQSKVNGLYIDVKNGLIQNGSNIQMYEGNESAAQKFVFEKVEKPTCDKLLENGIYKISTELNSDMYLDIAEGSHYNKANLQIWSEGIVQQQKFKLKYNQNGYYEIISVNSGKVLDVAGGSNNNGTNVQQYESNNTEYQKWILQYAGNGYYYILSRGAEAYLDVAGGIASNGSNVQIYDGNGSTAQKYKFEKTQIIDSDNYQITIADNPNMAIDLDLPTSNAQVWTINTTSLNQKFKLEYMNDGYYKIICKSTGQALTVQNTNNVIQQAYTDSDNQKWKIEIGNNGYYLIKSKGTGLYLEVANGDTTNGSNIQVNEWNGTNSQKFKFNITITYTTGIYGYSGLKIAGDPRGSDLKYYKWGNGENVLFATFAIHGFEDMYNNDGSELVYIAEQFKEKLNNIDDVELSNKWTIYIFPCLNPDGTYYGYTNEGPGRTTLYSQAYRNKGVDMNRCWSVDFKKVTSLDRNYTGSTPFLAYEAVYLRDFLLANASKNGQTVLVDLHGWLDETMGDKGLGDYYTSELGLSGKHVNTYGYGYLINWAKKNLGNSNKQARSVLVELPPVTNHNQVVSLGVADKYIFATIKMLKGII